MLCSCWWRFIGAETKLYVLLLHWGGCRCGGEAQLREDCCPGLKVGSAAGGSQEGESAGGLFPPMPNQRSSFVWLSCCSPDWTQGGDRGLVLQAQRLMLGRRGLEAALAGLCLGISSCEVEPKVALPYRNCDALFVAMTASVAPG